MPICKCCGADNHPMLMQQVKFDDDTFEVCGGCSHKINLFKDGKNNFQTFTNYLTDETLLFKLKNYNIPKQTNDNETNSEHSNYIETEKNDFISETKDNNEVTPKTKPNSVVQQFSDSKQNQKTTQTKDIIELLSKINNSNNNISNYEYDIKKTLISIDSNLKFIVKYIVIVTIVAIIGILFTAVVTYNGQKEVQKRYSHYSSYY